MRLIAWKWKGHFSGVDFSTKLGHFYICFLEIPVVFYSCIIAYIYIFILACSYNCIIVLWHVQLVASFHFCIPGNLHFHTFISMLTYFHTFTLSHLHTCIPSTLIIRVLVYLHTNTNILTCIVINLQSCILVYILKYTYPGWLGGWVGGVCYCSIRLSRPA